MSLLWLLQCPWLQPLGTTDHRALKKEGHYVPKPTSYFSLLSLSYCSLQCSVHSNPVLLWINQERSVVFWALQLRWVLGLPHGLVPAMCWGLRTQPSWSQQSLLALQSLKCSIHRRCNSSCFFQDFFQTSKVYKLLSNISKITPTSNTVWHLSREVWRYGLSNCAASSYSEW